MNYQSSRQELQNEAQAFREALRALRTELARTQSIMRNVAETRQLSLAQRKRIRAMAQQSEDPSHSALN